VANDDGASVRGIDTVVAERRRFIGLQIVAAAAAAAAAAVNDWIVLIRRSGRK
jgi:hypothetical protein